MTTIDDFQENAKELIDYLSHYIRNIRDRNVSSNVQPMYLPPLLPKEAPETSEDFKNILEDVENVIMRGVTHWRHPNFHGYFPSGHGYPSILGDILSAGIGCLGFNWLASPACTELEVVMMDWLARLLNLPEHFRFDSKGTGGGVIQSTASEATLVSMLSARARYVKKGEYHCEELSKLVAYTSNQAHFCTEKAALICAVRIRFLDTDDLYSLRGETLKKAIEEDKASGLIPFHCTATLGTTSSCAFDNLEEIGKICEEENIWLHVDAAYAGAAFVCEEFRFYMNGVERADSFNFNVHKMLLVDFDCSAMWFKNSNEVVDYFSGCSALFMRHDNESKVPDYRHWQIPLGRRFRSLKVWFVLRMYGKCGLQAHVRKMVRLADEFKNKLQTDKRFEIVAPVVLGLVCFRLKGENKLTETLYKRIHEDGKVFLVPSTLKDTYMIRFAIISIETNSADVEHALDVIKGHATYVLANQNFQ